MPAGHYLDAVQQQQQQQIIFLLASHAVYPLLNPNHHHRIKWIFHICTTNKIINWFIWFFQSLMTLAIFFFISGSDQFDLFVIMQFELKHLQCSRFDWLISHVFRCLCCNSISYWAISFLANQINYFVCKHQANKRIQFFWFNSCVAFVAGYN